MTGAGRHKIERGNGREFPAIARLCGWRFRNGSNNGKDMMSELRWDVVAAAALGKDDLVKLIRKLRWIGLTEEARQLECMASAWHRGAVGQTACYAP
jgi:hypothetical protein